MNVKTTPRPREAKRFPTWAHAMDALNAALPHLAAGWTGELQEQAAFFGGGLVVALYAPNEYGAARRWLA